MSGGQGRTNCRRFSIRAGARQLGDQRVTRPATPRHSRPRVTFGHIMAEVIATGSTRLGNWTEQDRQFPCSSESDKQNRPLDRA